MFVIACLLFVPASSLASEPVWDWNARAEIRSASGSLGSIESIEVTTYRRGGIRTPERIDLALGDRIVRLEVAAAYDLECRTVLLVAEAPETEAIRLRLALRDETRSTCWNPGPFWWHGRLDSSDGGTLELRADPVANPRRPYPR